MQIRFLYLFQISEKIFANSLKKWLNGQILTFIFHEEGMITGSLKVSGRSNEFLDLRNLLEIALILQQSWIPFEIIRIVQGVLVQHFVQHEIHVGDLFKKFIIFKKK